MTLRTLTHHLLALGIKEDTADLAQILSAVAVTVTRTSAILSRGPLVLDAPPWETGDNRQFRRGLRQLVTRSLFAQTGGIAHLAGISVLGSPTIHQVSPSGRHLLVFEPIHGVANLTDNLPVGSTFAILERSTEGPCTAEDFFQPGTRQLCAGMALFGPRTELILTTGDGVDGFTLDREIGTFVLTHPGIRIPGDGRMLAINPADSPYWSPAVKRYVEECVRGADGPRGHDYLMRWNASALLGVFRVLTIGGALLVPETKPGCWLAPLLHTAAPLAFLVEQAGGSATTGTRRVLDIVPDSLSACTPLFIGSMAEVARIRASFEAEDPDGEETLSHPLFHHRTLFSD